MDLGCVISSRHVFGIMPCLHEVLKAEVRKRERNSSAFLGPYLSSYEVHTQVVRWSRELVQFYSYPQQFVAQSSDLDTCSPSNSLARTGKNLN